MTAATTGTPTGGAVVAEERSWLGTPYRHQASLKGVGCDCLGLVRGVWRTVVGSEPEPLAPYTPDWAEAGGEETLKAAADRHLRPVPVAAMAPGDVLLFRYRPGTPAKHVAILVAPDRFIHAHAAAAVSEGHLGPWWLSRIAGVYRFPGVA